MGGVGDGSESSSDLTIGPAASYCACLYARPWLVDGERLGKEGEGLRYGQNRADDSEDLLQAECREHKCFILTEHGPTGKREHSGACPTGAVQMRS